MAGAAVVVAGLVALVHAFVRFARAGGTPAPVAPAARLVVDGLHRYVRNPMYVAVVAVIVGQALVLGQPALLLYGPLVWAATAAFVRWYEEPTLARAVGDECDAYRAAVPAWVPRLRPWTQRLPNDALDPAWCHGAVRAIMRRDRPRR